MRIPSRRLGEFEVATDGGFWVAAGDGAEWRDATRHGLLGLLLEDVPRRHALADDERRTTTSLSGGDRAGPVSGVLEMRARPERSDELRAFIAEMVASTHEHEPGTRTYEWFMRADGTFCQRYERHVDLAAALAHCQTFWARFAGWFISLLMPTRCTVHGSPDLAVQGVLSVLQPTFIGHAGGFHRW